MEDLILEFKFKIDLKIKEMNLLLNEINNDSSDESKKILIEIEKLNILNDKF